MFFSSPGAPAPACGGFPFLLYNWFMPFAVKDPHKRLASAILYQAIKAWKSNRIPPSERRRLLRFFGDAWFQDLCALALLDGYVVLKALSIDKALRAERKNEIKA